MFKSEISSNLEKIGYVNDMFVVSFLWLTDMEPPSANAPATAPATPDQKSISFYLTVYGTIAGLNAFFTLLRAFLFAYAGIHAASGLHKKIIKAVIRVCTL